MSSSHHAARALRLGRNRSNVNRSSRQLGLEGLEDRKLLSVSPGMLPSDHFGGRIELVCDWDYFQSDSFVASSETPGEASQADADLTAMFESLATTEAETAEADSANVPPVAADDAFAIAEAQQLGANVLGNDADADGDPISVALETDASNGTLVLRHDGLFTYTPDEGFAGVDSFTYTVDDGQAISDPATVSISVASVNSPPAAENDSYAVDEGQSLTVDAQSGIVANDADPDGDNLSARLVDAPQNGTVVLNGDGSFEYTPNAGYHGADAFTYAAADGKAESDMATVSITVEAVNEAPAATDDAYATSEGEALAVDASAGVLANDADGDGDAMSSAMVDGPENGTVVLNKDGSFEYTPNAGFHGTDSFTYTAGDGRAESELATVSITVEAVNEAPAATDDAYATSEGEALAVDASAGVLANDADGDGDAMSSAMVDGPENGTVVLNKDGSFEYTPNAGFHGTDRFTYTAGDGRAESELATVSVEVDRVELAIQLEVSATPFGADAGDALTGDTFWVNAYVQDLRDVPQGVVGGSIDVSFDTTVLDATGEVVYGEDFAAFQQGMPDEGAGMIDETGALATVAGVGADGLAPFAAWQFSRTADANGYRPNAQVQFGAEPGEGTMTVTPANFALVGSDQPVDWALADLGRVDLQLSTVDFNGDGLVNHFDLALWVPHSGAGSGDAEYDPAYDLDADEQIDDGDLRFLMSHMYQPAGSSAILPEAVDDLFAGDGLWS